MIKAICFIYCIIAFASANQKVINAYPYYYDSCSLTWVGDTVTFSNGISFCILGTSCGVGTGCLNLEFINYSYSSLGFKDTSKTDTNWIASTFMPPNLSPLDTLVNDSSTKYQGIFIGTISGFKTGSGGCTIFNSQGTDHRIIYAKAKDNTNMKFQIYAIRAPYYPCGASDFRPSFESINILFGIDSLGNGNFINNSTKLIIHYSNKLQRINKHPLFFDLKGSLQKNSMLNKFRCVIKKSS